MCVVRVHIENGSTECCWGKTSYIHYHKHGTPPNMCAFLNAIQRFVRDTMIRQHRHLSVRLYICFGRACSDFDCMLNNNFVATTFKNIYLHWGERGGGREVKHTECMAQQN